MRWLPWFRCRLSADRDTCDASRKQPRLTTLARVARQSESGGNLASCGSFPGKLNTSPPHSGLVLSYFKVVYVRVIRGKTTVTSSYRLRVLAILRSCSALLMLLSAGKYSDASAHRPTTHTHWLAPVTSRRDRGLIASSTLSRALR